MERVQDLEAERDDLSEAMAGSDELVGIAWMLQELRVSLFAQELGTEGRISEKRVREALARAVAP
jgi:ATP-dependent helicase HrpA